MIKKLFMETLRMLEYTFHKRITTPIFLSFKRLENNIIAYTTKKKDVFYIILNKNIIEKLTDKEKRLFLKYVLIHELLHIFLHDEYLKNRGTSFPIYEENYKNFPSFYKSKIIKKTEREVNNILEYLKNKEYNPLRIYGNVNLDLKNSLDRFLLEDLKNAEEVFSSFIKKEFKKDFYKEKINEKEKERIKIEELQLRKLLLEKAIEKKCFYYNEIIKEITKVKFFNTKKISEDIEKLIFEGCFSFNGIRYEITSKAIEELEKCKFLIEFFS
jgi:hypothetical protein